MGESARKEDKTKEFESAALEHIDSLFNFGMRMTRNREEAEDLVQETYLKVHRFSHTFKEGSNLKAWLFKILRNTFINSFRKKIREPKEVHYNEVEDFYLYNRIKTDKATDGNLSGDVANIYEFLEDEVKNAVDNLPLAFKEIVLYSDIEEFRKLLQKSLWNYANERGYLQRGRK
jgi:RNA polymerase sigma-70 factor, ECF subfamily